MLTRTVAVILTGLFLASLLNSSDAICRRPEETKKWRRMNVTERAAETDIVIYGEVISSPCWKPGFVKPTTPLPTTAAVLSSGNSSNVTSNATASTPQVVNATILPTTPPYNCSTEFYSAIIKVICVIKGGSVPLYIKLEGFGHGEGICLDESFHDYHAYNMLNYLIFIGRNKDVDSPKPFWINPVNHQPATTEISDESKLKPIFESIGRNAHMPLGVGNTTVHDVCKPYVESSAHVCCSAYSSILLVLAFMASSFLFY